MKLPLPRNPALRMLVCFAFWYAAFFASSVLIERSYCTAFRAVGSMLYGRNNREKEIGFEPLNQSDHFHCTRVVIVNPARMKPDGSGPVRNLDLDTRAFGWMPLALVVGLILATPIPWPRRGRSLLWGLLWHQAFVFVALGFCIWNESAEVGLVTLSPNWKGGAATLKNLLAREVAMAVPFLVWLLVTLRKGDSAAFKSPSAGKNAASKSLADIPTG